MFCPCSPSGIHCLETPLPGKNIQRCSICNKWLLAAEQKVVDLPPPAALAATAPIRDPDTGLGDVVPFPIGA